MNVLDQWWLNMFRRLLDLEQKGVDPNRLCTRWLILNHHTSLVKKRPRWQTTFAIPELIAHFLDDHDIRAKDRAYAEHQWAATREWLNA